MYHESVVGLIAIQRVPDLEKLDWQEKGLRRKLIQMN
jgi:hypothetical protein